MVLGLRGVKKTRFLRSFLLRECSKKHENTTYLTIFRLYLVGGSWRFSSGFKCRNTVIYGVFVRLAWQKYVLQHAENCVNTTVFARCWPVNTVVLGLRGVKKNTVFTEFFAPRMFKKHENTTYLTIFRLYLVGGSWRFSSGFKCRNTVIYGVFVRLAWQKYVLQHAENCVNTTVFACWP